MARDGDPPRPPGGPTRKLSLHSTRIEIARGASEIAVDDFVDSALSERPQTVPEMPQAPVRYPMAGGGPAVAPRPGVGARLPRDTRPGLGELDEPTSPEAAPHGSEARRLLDDKERRIRELEAELARAKRELDQAHAPQVTVREEEWEDDEDDPRTRAVSHVDVGAVRPPAPAATAAPAWRRAEPPVRGHSQPSMPAVLMRPDPSPPAAPVRAQAQPAVVGPTRTVRMAAMQPPIPRTDVPTPPTGIGRVPPAPPPEDDAPQPTMVLSSVGASPIAQLVAGEIAAHPPFEAPSLPPVEVAAPRPVQLAASVPPHREGRVRDAGDSTAIPVVLSAEAPAPAEDHHVAPAPPPPYEVPAAGPEAAAPPPRRSRAPWVALAGLLLAGGGLGGAFALGIGPFGEAAPARESSRAPQDEPDTAEAAPAVAPPTPSVEASASSAAAPPASAAASAAATASAEMATPPAPSASASPAPTATAPAGEVTSTPAELAALLSFQGYLTVSAPIDAEVVVQGVSAGRTNERLLVRCGPRNVRLRDAGGVWKSAGDHAKITCMQHTTITILPTP